LLEQGARVVVQYDNQVSSPVIADSKTITPHSLTPPRDPLTSPPTNISSPDRPGTPSAPTDAMVTHIPKVSYSNGLLSIEADNSTLSDVIFAISEKTGASIDMPFSNGMLDRVTFTMGPAKPRDILATFLEGSSYNYYIVENNSGGLQKVILTPK
jgi:hypothetical protein